MSGISRTQFLRGDFSGERGPLRPPWSIDEDDFTDRCDRCGACVKACPEGILQAGRGGFPQVDFARGECTFCGLCAQHCRQQVLQLGGTPWQLRAEVRDNCLAERGINCRSCDENCPQAALHFRLLPGGRATAAVDEQSCTGCGACYRPCPVGAIRLRTVAVRSSNAWEGA